MRQQKFEAALREIAALATTYQDDGAELPSAILERVGRIAAQTLKEAEDDRQDPDHR